jgi:hypothetical protein
MFKASKVKARPAMARRAKMTTGGLMLSVETGYWFVAMSWFGGWIGEEENGAT